MTILGFDHIVLAVRDVTATCKFYSDLLDMEAREERPGKWSLHFGTQKISLQDAAHRPALADGTLPGSGNFCLLTDTPIGDVAAHLRARDIEIVAGPAEKVGATGPILSVYFRDPDGNLVEVSNRIQAG